MVSIRKSESIDINRASLDEYFGDNDRAIMYYDPDNNRVGIKPVTDTDVDDAAYTVTKSESGGTIAPQTFLEKHGLVPEITKQYEPDRDEEKGLLVISVDEQEDVGRERVKPLPPIVELASTCARRTCYLDRCNVWAGRLLTNSSILTELNRVR